MSFSSDFITSFINKDKEYAITYCTDNGINFRLIREDDVYYVVVRDFKTDRLNFEIENGFVVKCKIG